MQRVFTYSEKELNSISHQISLYLFKQLTDEQKSLADCKLQYSFSQSGRYFVCNKSENELMILITAKAETKVPAQPIHYAYLAMINLSKLREVTNDQDVMQECRIHNIVGSMDSNDTKLSPMG